MQGDWNASSIMRYGSVDSAMVMLSFRYVSSRLRINGLHFYGDQTGHVSSAALFVRRLTSLPSTFMT